MVDFTALMTFTGLVALASILGLIVVNAMKKVRLGSGIRVTANILLSVMLVGAVWQSGFLKDVGIGPQAIGTVPVIPAVSESPKPITADSGTGEITRMVGGQICRIQSDGDNSILVAVRNDENNSLAYVATTITAETDPQTNTLDSATSTSGATLSYQTLNVEPCNSGFIYALASSGLGVSGTRVAFDSFGTKISKEIATANQNDINVQSRDRSFTANSQGLAVGSGTSYVISTTGATDGTVYVANTSYDSGSSATFYLDFQVNGTAGVYGTYGATDGIGLSFDSVDASKWSANALTLQQVDDVQLNKLSSCPGTLSANRNAEACWSAKTLRSGITYRVKSDIQADAGDPAVSGDDPILYVDDKVYFRDTDGKIKYDFYDSSGSNKGMGGLKIVFVAN